MGNDLKKTLLYIQPLFPDMNYSGQPKPS